MKLKTITLDKLTVSKTNVRKAGGKNIAKSVDDLIPSIRSLGVLQPLLVREYVDGFEIVAGQRRYHACLALAEEDKTFAKVPCMIMQDGDDAKAIEASLAENIARLPMDEIDQYRAFAALVGEGKSAEDIAVQFGVTERLVTQRLAIANLYASILNAYRRDEIEASTMRALTMATKRQQQEWWTLHKSDDQWAPTGRALKRWLFGGASIPEKNALFDVAESGLALIGDLFGEDRYFADSAAFWPLQSAAVSEMAERFAADGWPVTVHEIGEHWQGWNYASVSKEDGGETHIVIASDGEVSVHEGVLDRDVLRKRHKAEDSAEAKPVKPEITKAMQNYLALHRHVAVRADVLGNFGLALRLIAAHMIAGSGLWHIKAEPQQADKDATSESLAASPLQQAFEAERASILDLLGMREARAQVAERLEADEDMALVQHHCVYQGGFDKITVLQRLIKLDDAQVTRILTFVMAETLEADSAMVEYLGQVLGTDPAAHWAPDEAFFDLLRDKQAINAMVAEAAGKSVAKGNMTATAKVQKGILADCLSGKRKDGNKAWTPRYMAFPMQAYTDRGGIRAIDLAESLPEADDIETAKAA